MVSELDYFSLAHNNLLAYVRLQFPGYRIGGHHRKIADALMAVERGEINRLILQAPPRHGKSMLTSEYFPAWFLGRNPEKYIITATYGQDLADDFGRKVRNQLRSGEHRATFPQCQLSEDSQSASRFGTEQGGAYFALGVGAPATGRGAHLLVIDDPIKGREEADSETYRKRLKEWYASVAYTRLMPGGAIIIMACMTGETPVLRPDGTETPLRDIRKGDMVATYKNGKLSTSKVLNWVNNGSDFIYEIKTISGKIVRANDRHPFLVFCHGEMQWIRTKNLRRGHAIVRVNGESGKGKLARLMGAISRFIVAGTALNTTIKNDGQMVLGHHPAMPNLCEPQELNIATESQPRTTSDLILFKEGSARFADSRQETMCAHTGEENCASITVTKQERSGICSVMTAILLSGMQKLRRLLKPLPITSDFILDEISEITAAGFEDVFDVQIDETENFIANGLVSHNTRWHEDDLIGWVLSEHEHEEWTVIDLPAIDKGKALWPEQYSLEDLNRIKQTLGQREWQALYMQRPTPDTGDYFKREWFKSYEKAPKHLRIYGASDYAVTADGGDYTEHGVFGLDTDGDLYLLDWWSGQTASDVWIETQLDLIDKWMPQAWIGESGPIRRSVEPFLRRRMRERRSLCSLEWLPSISDKPTRARPFQAMASSGMVYLPTKEDWAQRLIRQLLTFPVGVFDDAVDVCSLVGRYLDKMRDARLPDLSGRHAPKPGTFDHLLAMTDEKNERSKYRSLR